MSWTKRLTKRNEEALIHLVLSPVFDVVGVFLLFFAFVFCGLVFILSPELLNLCLRYLDNIINFSYSVKN